MLSVALTGNVASGKSTVARIWEAARVPVVSADDLARKAVERGSRGLHDVVEAFGEDVLASDGGLDRARLRALVFSDPEARVRLEAILHPIIWRLRDQWLAARRSERATLVVSEIPLLFETGRQDDFDVVVFVDSSEPVRLARMVEHRNVEPREGQRIMAAQMDPASKRALAHHVIVNDGTLDELHHEADRVLAKLRERGEAA